MMEEVVTTGAIRRAKLQSTPTLMKAKLRQNGRSQYKNCENQTQMSLRSKSEPYWLAFQQYNADCTSQRAIQLTRCQSAVMNQQCNSISGVVVSAVVVVVSVV